MTSLKIKTFPDNILRKKAKKISKLSNADREDLSQMAEVMYLNGGVGLAAVQVGIDKQLVVIDVGQGLVKMANPTIIKKAGCEACEEGCLSVPGVNVIIKRAKTVTVNYLNDTGEVVRLDAEGLLARAIQHEIDHLCGVLIIDYLNPLRKLIAKSRLSKTVRKQHNS